MLQGAKNNQDFAFFILKASMSIQPYKGYEAAFNLSATYEHKQITGLPLHMNLLSLNLKNSKLTYASGLDFLRLKKCTFQKVTLESENQFWPFKANLKMERAKRGKYGWQI